MAATAALTQAAPFISAVIPPFPVLQLEGVPCIKFQNLFAK